MRKILWLFSYLNATVPGISESNDALEVVLDPTRNPLLGLPVVTTTRIATPAGPIVFLFYGTQKVGCLFWHGSDDREFAIAVTLEHGELRVKEIAVHEPGDQFAPFIVRLRGCAKAAMVPEPRFRNDPIGYMRAFHLPRKWALDVVDAI